ncbi:hypothetical protein J3R30DRAFT_2600829 [Lentinula aciculospora]|uniref:Uncharacterized protein n=1 Tax=Lentinula aciculospora TaxID=153920 RepID=A0A9W9DQK3_9AGAR|nr:hypothetical protein J3R30DRAFT_2600829 [Lentinula aciculospora]
MNSRSLIYSGDATTTFDQCSISEQQSYAEFCLMLESSVSKPEDKDTSKNPLKAPQSQRLSYVRNWRQNITPLEIASPPSPFGASQFPTSPVADVSPDQLRITSLPPYDPRAVIALMGSSTSTPFEQSTVNEPTGFYDLYDAELEQMIDEMESSSASSSTLSATVIFSRARSKGFYH